MTKGAADNAVVQRFTEVRSLNLGKHICNSHALPSEKITAKGRSIINRFKVMKSFYFHRVWQYFQITQIEF